eukprot:CAMPEP_0196658684 /NCGR_PEP_ID=MMETSP1086-20130531/30942_1 /TAXON_ID=77921 /ORGANISM="Cyanoptyche  gloeocystis , Strain SAG4.97" /LENGTH=158 /DNA_ID=CAMNT_0041992355 /DNA_START=151 /DNA_END=628 /DNA_ORIENTATION=-
MGASWGSCMGDGVGMPQAHEEEEKRRRDNEALWCGVLRSEKCGAHMLPRHRLRALLIAMEVEEARAVLAAAMVGGFGNVLAVCSSQRAMVGGFGTILAVCPSQRASPPAPHRHHHGVSQLRYVRRQRQAQNKEHTRGFTELSHGRRAAQRAHATEAGG